jgi:hypothetical protein
MRGDAQRFFAAFFTRPRLVVCVHELADLCDYNANGAPPAVRRYIAQGRALGKGLLAGTQRPVGIPRQARTEATDFFIFVPKLSDEDHGLVARDIGINPDALAQQLNAAHDQLGDYSFLRYAKKTRELTVCPPLPAHVRKHNIVRRVEDA